MGTQNQPTTSSAQDSPRCEPRFQLVVDITVRTRTRGAVMAVVSPHLCGMGGDLLAMVAAPGADPVALLAVGRAGSGVDPASLRNQGKSVMPHGATLRSVPVPGAVDGWLDAA